MDAQLKIVEILKHVTCRDVIFAGNKTPPELLAFAVHFPRLTVVIDGNYHVQMEQNRRVVDYIAKPGQAIIIPPNCWDKPNMQIESRTLHFLFGKRHTGISLVSSGIRVRAEKIALPHAMADPEQKILDAVIELRQTTIDYPSFGELINGLLSCYVHRLQDYDKPASRQSNLLFQEICIYIQENFQNEISRDSVALHHDISPNYLSRLFKTKGHMKFCDYVNYVRINRAKFLLQNYDLPLYHIAPRCGYNDVVYFCKIFKKITKKTPKQYRNLAANVLRNRDISRLRAI